MNRKDDHATKGAITRLDAQSIHSQRADAARGRAIIDLEVGLSDHERRLKTIEARQPPD
jgi:hypothetical protein